MHSIAGYHTYRLVVPKIIKIRQLLFKIYQVKLRKLLKYASFLLLLLQSNIN